MEFVQITAQYSNAVLLAVLPYVSDFAHKLSLPILTPVVPAHVMEFRCDPRRDKVGGLVTLTNGFRFSFLDGRVCAYHSTSSYFSLQDLDSIQKFCGPVKLTEREAIKIARDVTAKLGYPQKAFHADASPQVSLPERIGTNLIARYRIRWLDPDWPEARKAAGFMPSLLDVEVDGATGQIQMVSMSTRTVARASPKVDVAPPPLRAVQPDTQKRLSGGVKTDPVSTAYSRAFLNAILPQISDFAAKVSLGLPRPLTTNEVDVPRYFCGLLDGQPIAQVFLKNGDRFNYEHGHVAAFYARDAYWKFPDHGRLEDFLGRINITPNQALALCERAIRNLGYKGKLPKASFGERTFVGTNEFSRYIFHWWKPGQEAEIASFEVDADTRLVRSVYFDDPSLWRNPPKIDAPLELSGNRTNASQTNAPSGEDLGLEETIRFLDKNMGYVTNTTNKAAPQVKPPNPFE